MSTLHHKRLALGLLAILVGVGACGATQRATVTEGDPAQGLVLWAQSACVGCHGVDAQGSTAGPALADTPLTLREVSDITRRGGPGMPNYSASQVTDQELQDMYAWFQAPVLPPTGEPQQTPPTSVPGQPGPAGELGEEAWRLTGCAGCHGADALGGNGPSLAGASQPFSAFQAVVRQGAPGMPAYSESQVSGATLQAIYTWLQSQAQIPDVQQTVWLQAGCGGCHGANAEGASAPALAGKRSSYDEFRRVVRGGDEGMPAYGTSRLSDTDLQQMYQWLMALP